METRPLDNWVRAYDWQGRRQGDEPVVYRIERWEVPPFWNVARALSKAWSRIVTQSHKRSHA